MTWISHTTIATALALPFNPAAIPAAVAGSTAPDWLENIIRPFYPVEHRKETHYLVLWLLLLLCSFLIDINNMLFWFALGGLSHIAADSLTISGIPLSPWHKTKFHLFGGKIKEGDFYKFRTGDLSEYIIAFSMLAFALYISNPHTIFSKNSDTFNPFYINNHKLYEEKIIDEKEYRERRFEFF